MEYHQIKKDTEIKITIEKTSLTYLIKNNSSKAEFSVLYEYISANEFEFTEKNSAYKHQAIYLLIIGIVFLVVGIGILLLIGSAILFILYRRSITKYTKLEAGKRIILIMHDGQHEEILKEIFKARNTYLKMRYGIINPNNSSKYELRKFAWLLSKKVITEKEFEKIKMQLGKNEKKLLN